MTVASRKVFDAEVARALASLGARDTDRALDGLSDPIGAARGLRAFSELGGEPVLLRAGPELGASAEYGPAPATPVWIRLEGTSIRVAPLRLAADEPAEAVEASRVVVEVEELPCCSASGCDRKRTHAAAWLVLAGRAARPRDGAAGHRRLLVAEARSLEAGRAEGVVEAVAARLARGLEVPLETRHGTEPADGIAPRSALERGDDEEPPALGAAAVAPYFLRTEGEPLVLRDHASLGPRGSVPRNVVVGLLLVAASAPFWVYTARTLSAGQYGAAAGLGAAALLLSLAGYAFLGVARFSSKYVAHSSPLAWFSRDRFVVAPWVNRLGAIDLKPEGRLGAAIPTGELRRVQVQRRDGRWAVEFDTDHGTLDVLRAEAEDEARYWSSVIVRAAASVRHPGGPSAKQRLRAKAQAQAGTAGTAGKAGAAGDERERAETR